MKYDYKILKLDINFVKNLPLDLLNELISFDDVIPDGIQSQLFDLNETFNIERGKVILDMLHNKPEYGEKVYEMRYAWRPDDFMARDFEEDLTGQMDLKQACEFIKEHPQFKPIIEKINYYVHNGGLPSDLVYEEPFDEYFEKYLQENEN